MGKSGDYLIVVGGTVAETLVWDGPPFAMNEPEDLTQGRHDLAGRAEARAYELRGLAYEVRNPNWKESAHRSFRCEETPDGNHVRVFSPVGTFRIAARRAKRGEVTSTVAASASGRVYGFGATASQDQEALPIRIAGRLNAPQRCMRSDWTFQPSHFEYEDGTCSGWLGSYPLDIEWEGTAPAWQFSEHW